jgi:peptide/nickel transport system permease protein
VRERDLEIMAEAARVNSLSPVQNDKRPALEMSQRQRLMAGFRLLMRDKVIAIALCFLLLVLLSALLADVLVQAQLLPDPNTQNLLLRNNPPGIAADGSFRPFGTDQLGRDLLSRVVFGARISLSVGITTVLVSVLIGMTLGVLAGYYRTWVDDLIMRLVDIQMGFPTLILALAVLYVAGPGFRNLILVLALTRWPIVARLARGMTLSLREMAYVEAARASGATNLRIMRQHIVPNLLSPILVVATLEFASVMLAEAALSFLGMGIQPPESSWGLMLSQGRTYMTTAWWLVVAPGVAILLTTLAANLLATSLRSISDPTQRWRWNQ